MSITGDGGGITIRGCRQLVLHIREAGHAGDVSSMKYRSARGTNGGGSCRGGVCFVFEARYGFAVVDTTTTAVVGNGGGCGCVFARRERAFVAHSSEEVLEGTMFLGTW